MKDAGTGRNLEIIGRILEYGVYLYLFLMFLAKGEGIRNILIFGGFGLWLMTLRHRKNLYLLGTPVAKLLYVYLATIIISAIFSLDPAYSFRELKSQPLKCALLFPVIATTMDSNIKIRNAMFACFFAIIIPVSDGYYSYIIGDTQLLKPTTEIAHAYHNRFAGYINTLLPLSFPLLFIVKRRAIRTMLGIVFIVTFVALLLTTSRGGYVAFAGILIVWSFYLSSKKKYDFKKVAAVILAISLLIGASAYLFVPVVKTRVNNLSRSLSTFNLRTELWGAAWEGFLQRPVFGWGYGGNIFHMEEPFAKTSFITPPERGEHNMYLTALFHQGLTGFVPFVMLMIAATVAFWRGAYRFTGMKSYMLIACASIFLGNYILHAQFESMFKLPHYAVVLGLGTAAMGIDEDSDN